MIQLRQASWFREKLRGREGATLAFTAVVMVALLSTMALAVDLAMAFTARGEAQRVADAAALAGASAFLDFNPPASAVAPAEARLFEYALNNTVRNQPLDSTNVSYQVLPAEQKVRVWITKDGLPAWFARLLGIKNLSVKAMAAAEASLSGQNIQGQCILPFAIVDLWDDQVTTDKKTPCENGSDDCNADAIPNGGENWQFDEGDGYHPFDTETEGTYSDFNGTGFGSDWRGEGGDFGRRFWVKAGPPGQSGGGAGGEAGGLDDMVAPGNFYLWDIPTPDNGCDPNNAPTGMPWVEENIATCNTCQVSTGVEYTTEPGNKAALKDEIEDLYETDPGATWDEDCNCITGSMHGDHEDAVNYSGRVRVVALWDPSQGGDLRGRDALTFNNFAKVFLEGGGVSPPDFQIFARFLGPVAGTGEGGAGTGSLIRNLRLVE